MASTGGGFDDAGGRTRLKQEFRDLLARDVFSKYALKGALLSAGKGRTGAAMDALSRRMKNFGIRA